MQCWFLFVNMGFIDSIVNFLINSRYVKGIDINSEMNTGTEATVDFQVTRRTHTPIISSFK